MREIAKAVEWHRHQVFLNKQYRNEMKIAKFLGNFYGAVIGLIVLALDIVMYLMKGV